MYSRVKFIFVLMYISTNCLFVLLLFLSTVHSKENEQLFVQSVAGHKVSLPCNMTPSLSRDHSTLLLWYKGDSETPFYSLDNRAGTDGLEPVHFRSKSMGVRSYFAMTSSPAVLEILEVQESDKGIYRCRVDFLRSRTVNYELYLDVIVPPETPVVRDEIGDRLSGTIGPYNEGDPLFLTCEVKQGKPRPSLMWWKGSNLIQSKYVETPGGIVKSDLILAKLTRDLLHAKLMCEASNNNITQPPSNTLKLEMNFKPKSVKITTPKEPLSAKRKAKLICVSAGSRPPAVMTWWKGTKKLKRIEYLVSEDGKTSTSVLTFVPSSSDGGKYLSCRADNPSIPGSAMEDGWKLNIKNAPELTLIAGSGLDGGTVDEGDDILLSCKIKANPWVDSVEWLFNGKPLLQNLTEGILISNDSLQLQRVNKNKKGDYTCLARNSEGKGISNSVTVRIKYAPVCKTKQVQIYGVSMHESASVLCEVDADPSFVTFQWRFNNTVEEFGIIDFTSTGLTSTATYTPRAVNDFGFLYCYASNIIAKQQRPCVYSLVFAGPPESVDNCTVVNKTTDTLHVRCLPGYDGGLPQLFIMEVYEEFTHRLQANVTSERVPEFVAFDLPSDMNFMILVYSANDKGRSSHTHKLTANTLKFTQKHTSTKHRETTFRFNPVIGILIGVVASLVLIAVIIVVSMRMSRWKPKNKKDSDHIKTHIPFQTTIIDQDFQQYEMKDPDIIPARNSVNDSGYEDCSDDTARKKQNNEYDASNTQSSSSPNNILQNNKRDEEVAYAELSLPPKMKTSSKLEKVRRKDIPTEYATIDFQKKKPRLPPPRPTNFKNDIKMAAVEDVNVDELSTTADTPLMNNKLESTV